LGEPAIRTEFRAIPEVRGASEISLRGDVTVDEVPELRRAILDELERSSASKLVIALAGVKRMDTSGAAVLAEALKVGQQRGMRVLLCSPSPAVLQIFRLAGFGEVLRQCCSDPAETRERLLA
jgi:anti-anti-sigma factor